MSDRGIMQPHAPSPRLRIPDDVLFQTVADESVLLDVKQGQYFGLNAAGTRMWQLLAEHGTADAVVRGIVDEFDVDAQTVQQDVDALIGDLVARGLLIPDTDAGR